MKRERIEEIIEYLDEPNNMPGELEPNYGEIKELAFIALKATEPGMVMVPREPTEKMIECAVDNMDPNQPNDYIAHHAYMDMIHAFEEDQA